MPRVGTSLDSIVAQSKLRVVGKVEIRPGSEQLLKLKAPSIEDLFTEVSGVKYPLFILGVHDPDDAVTARYIL